MRLHVDVDTFAPAPDGEIEYRGSETHPVDLNCGTPFGQRLSHVQFIGGKISVQTA